MKTFLKILRSALKRITPFMSLRPIPRMRELVLIMAFWLITGRSGSLRTTRSVNSFPRCRLPPRKSAGIQPSGWSRKTVLKKRLKTHCRFEKRILLIPIATTPRLCAGQLIRQIFSILPKAVLTLPFGMPKEATVLL